MDILPKARRWRVWTAVGTAAVMVVVLAGAAEGARRYDESRADVFLSGIVVGGVPVGGLTFDEAATRVRAVWEDPLDARVNVWVGDEMQTVTPRQLGASTDAMARLEAAVAAQRRLPFPVRVWHRLSGRDATDTYAVTQRVDRPSVEAFVDALAEQVYRAPVDSRIDTSSGFVRLTDEVDGFGLRKEEAVEGLSASLHAGHRRIELPGEALTPQTRRSDHGTILLVRVGENKLYHYVGERLVKTYPVAAGKSSNPTPKGRFEVVNKRRNPTWINPAPRGWGKNMPARIGPGPRNPLGTRALDINSPGIRIHGTSDAGSIGYNASQGCIRMRMSDVEELFELVPVGTPVVILQAGADRPRPVPVAVEEPPAEADATPVLPADPPPEDEAAA